MAEQTAQAPQRSAGATNRAKMYQLVLFPFNNGATNVYYVLLMNYIAYYANGVLGLLVAFATTMVTVTRIFDALIDPVVGMFIDRTETKIGKFRPFIIAGNVIMAVFSILLFYGTRLIPEDATALRYVGYTVLYMGLMVGYAIQTSCTRSGQTCLTNDPNQRPTFTMFNTIASLVGMGVTMAVASIVGGAFQPRAFTGGVVGSVFLSLKKGVSRGIFSNEAGLGTGSIAHACADTKKPVKQGMFGIFEVFADTIVICTLTALVILCSGTPVPYGSEAGAELTISGFTTTYGSWVSLFTMVALCCFAFSTIIGWGLYGSTCISYLCRTEKVIRPFLVVYSFVAILGATMDLGLLWSIADTFNGLMAIPNLIALLLLSGTVVRLVREFFAGEGEAAPANGK